MSGTQDIRLDIRALLSAQSEALCQRYSARRVGIFGSYARGDANALSDLDILVEFDRPTFKNFMGLKLFLEDATGLSVDVVTPNSLHGRLREHILREVDYVA